MIGVFFKANRVTQIEENTYVFEDLDYEPWEDFKYIDLDGNNWYITSITISDEVLDDDIIEIKIKYNQDSSIKDILEEGIECKRWEP